MSTIKVFGHKSPDTDATSSAIVWTWFLNNHRKQESEAFVLGYPNTEALFVLKKWGHAIPSILEKITKEDSVTIVDTNSADELFENINDAHIVSIIDHHKLTGGLKTTSPREIVIQPYASTMTVMYNVMNIEPSDFPREIAGLMLSGIISDTLAFRSPTTTDDDKKLAERLAHAVSINIDEYANEMFEAKSDISHLTDKEIILLDSKITEIKDSKMRISVIETTSPEVVMERKDSLVIEMDKIAKEDSVDHILLFIIDILKEDAVMITSNEKTKELVLEGFPDAIERENGILLPGIVSRKKQIIPILSA